MLLLFGQTQTVTMHNIRPVYCQCWKCGNNRVKLGWKGVRRRHIGLFYYSCPLIVGVQVAWGKLSTPRRHVRKTRKFRCLFDVVLISSPKLSCNVFNFHLTYIQKSIISLPVIIQSHLLFYLKRKTHVITQTWTKKYEFPFCVLFHTRLLLRLSSSWIKFDVWIRFSCNVYKENG